jgi:acyl-CoA thioester hydrolase
MTKIMPQSGSIKGKIHYFNIRVYYEDTDIGGVVYYANYLKFMERARSEMLRDLGIDQAKMLDYTKPEDVSFVVKRAEIDFNRSAKFDDQLIVKSEIVKLGGASVIIKQDVTKNDQILVTGMIKIAVIGQDGKPKKLPKSIKEKLNR